MASKIITEELKKEIIEFYQSYPMAIKTVCEKFNFSSPTVTKILKDIPRYPKALIFNPNLKEDFFDEIDTEEKAYFLGLLISDGNVFSDETGRQASISITLDSNDEYILNTFRKVLGANTSIAHDSRGCSQIAVRSNKMAKALAKYGVVPRKSYITYLPLNIPKEMLSHLIRGIFDGDGSIQAHQHGTRFLHAFSFCGSHKLMQDIVNYFQEHLDLIGTISIYDYKDKELSDFKLQTVQDMYTFGEWIYKDATIYLKRKKDKYLEFKKHYNLD